MTPRVATGIVVEQLLSVEQVAAICQVPPKSVHRWLYLGTGPKSLKVGRHRRFRAADVEAWLETLAASG